MSRSAELFRIRVLTSTLALATVLGGCSDLYYDRRETVALYSGDAAEVNKVAQMTDPWPLAAENRNIDANGEKIQSAIERYRTNRVIPPQGTGTSSVSYSNPSPPPAVAPSK
jgi:hypothetical protein